MILTYFCRVAANGKSSTANINEVKKDIEAVDLAVSGSTISAAKLNVAETARKARLLTLNRKEIRPCDS